jgi:hypothetical protein
MKSTTNLKGGHHVRDMSKDGMVILNLTLRNCDRRTLSGLNRVRTGNRDRLF